MSKDALQTLMKLPRMAYGILNGSTVTIARGASRGLPICLPASLVDTLNSKSGITRYQRLAMEAGVTFGWTSDAADPDYHARANGEPAAPKRQFTVFVPLMMHLEVKAMNAEDALSRAKHIMEDRDIPDFIEVDGPLSIIDEVEL